MKNPTKTVLFLAVICPFATLAQGDFQNLDFENATIVSYPNNQGYPTVYANQAIPGWTAYFGNIQTSTIWYNAVSTGAASIDIIGPGYQYGTAINGQYSLFLQAGPSPFTGTIGPVSISQTGVVPAGTQSLLFDSSYYIPVQVYIGNQLIPATALGTGPNNTTIYGANISAWAGQTVQLTFTADSYCSLDDISFSSQPLSVPEPEAYALCLFGIAGLFGCRRWFKATS